MAQWLELSLSEFDPVRGFHVLSGNCVGSHWGASLSLQYSPKTCRSTGVCKLPMSVIVNDCLSEYVSPVVGSLTYVRLVTQQRTAHADLMLDSVEVTCFFTFFFCPQSYSQPTSAPCVFSSLSFISLPSFCCLIFPCSLLLVSSSSLFLCDDAAPFCSQGAKIVHGGQQAVFGRQPSHFCVPVLFSFFFSFFMDPAPLQPGSNWA